jgi:N-ethylmaleimide reductase
MLTSSTYAESLLQEGLIDLAAFGKPFIANPDFVARIKKA